jgi:hypothetical protein
MGAVVGFQSVLPLDRPVDFRLQPVRSWWSGDAGTTAAAILLQPHRKDLAALTTPGARQLGWAHQLPEVGVV